MELQTKDAKLNDRWLIAPYVCLMLFPITLITLSACNLDFESVFFIVCWSFIALGLLIVMPFIAWVLYRTHRRRMALSTILLPICALLLLISTRLCASAGDVLYFYRIHDSLQREVDRTDGKDAQKLVIWVTNGWLSSAHGYVYDGSDEVALPAGQQSATWKKRAYRTELEDLCFDATHITGHYYRFATTHGC